MCVGGQPGQSCPSASSETDGAGSVRRKLRRGKGVRNFQVTGVCARWRPPADAGSRYRPRFARSGTRDGPAARIGA